MNDRTELNVFESIKKTHLIKYFFSSIIAHE